MKTHSSAKKKFRVTGSGKVKRFQANTSHRLRQKSKQSKKDNREMALVHPSDEKRVKRMLCIA